MLNPGSGAERKDGADERLRDLIRTFADGESNLDLIMAHQGSDVANWGRGRLINFLNLAGLEVDNIALLNIAWCATAQNKYPSSMLRRCFGLHTARALLTFVPDVVVLSGKAVHRFAKPIESKMPSVRVLTTLHFAHREGKNATIAAADAIRAELDSGA